MAPLPPHEARKHKIFLLALFSSLVLSSALFTYFMLLPFSQFAAASPRANKPDEHHESSIKDHVGALGSSSPVADLAEHDAYANLSHEHDALWHHRDLLPPTTTTAAATSESPRRRRTATATATATGLAWPCSSSVSATR